MLRFRERQRRVDVVELAVCTAFDGNLRGGDKGNSKELEQAMVLRVRRGVVQQCRCARSLSRRELRRRGVRREPGGDALTSMTVLISVDYCTLLHVWLTNICMKRGTLLKHIRGPALL